MLVFRSSTFDNFKIKWSLDKGIFVKFEEKLRSAFFLFATNTLEANKYYHK